MSREDIVASLSTLMRDLFRLPDLVVTDTMVAADVPGWDSLAHINFVVAVEKQFSITLSTREVRNMKNVGALIDIIEKKTA